MRPPQLPSAESAQAIANSLGVAEWLGPLAPVALSPFFGICLLSGLASFGGDWLPDSWVTNNALIGSGSTLANPAIFWVFLALSVGTSLPRLTKVSKPFAQAADQVEAWAGILTMLALRMLIGAGAGDGDEVAVVHAGVFSFTADTLLMLAGALNIFVINAVKFLLEVAVWITPFPFVDALFEAANKGLCAALVAIYAFSPFLATLINLALLAVCAIVFGWAYRRQVFYRSMLTGILRSWLGGRSRAPETLVVFPKDELGPFKARARCSFTKTENGWRLEQKRLFGAPLALEIQRGQVRPVVRGGFLTNTLQLGEQGACSFSRAWHELEELALRQQVSVCRF